MLTGGNTRPSFIRARDGDIIVNLDPSYPAHRDGSDPDRLHVLLAELGFGSDDEDELAVLLADAGRTEDAVDLLTSDEPGHRYHLSTYLLDLGRVDDAVAALQR